MALSMTTEPSVAAHQTFMQRVFGLEKHEHFAFAWSFAYFFCVLSSYYILRPVRDSMAVGSGPNTIPWLFVATFITMMVAAPIFGWVASRYPRRRFLPWVYLFFISNSRSGLPLIFSRDTSLRHDSGQTSAHPPQRIHLSPLKIVFIEQS